MRHVDLHAHRSVTGGLDHFAKRLDQIIARELSPHLTGHSRTVVLEILDQKSGFASGYPQRPCDLDSQLRSTWLADFDKLSNRGFLYARPGFKNPH